MKNNKLLSLVLAGCMIGSTSLNTVAISNYNANKKIVEHKMVNMAKEADDLDPEDDLSKPLDENEYRIATTKMPSNLKNGKYEVKACLFNLSTTRGTTEDGNPMWARPSMGQYTFANKKADREFRKFSVFVKDGKASIQLKWKPTIGLVEFNWYDWYKDSSDHSKLKGGKLQDAETDYTEKGVITTVPNDDGAVYKYIPDYVTSYGTDDVITEFFLPIETENPIIYINIASLGMGREYPQDGLFSIYWDELETIELDDSEKPVDPVEPIEPDTQIMIRISLISMHWKNI